MEAKEYLIALNMVDSLGSLGLRELLSRFSKPDEIFKASIVELMKSPGVSQETAYSIKRIISSNIFKREIRSIDKKKIKVITIIDKKYPLNLKSIYDPPVVIYVKGTLEAKDAVSIAVVGSRKASFGGLKLAHRISKELAQSEITVISGLARGIDSASHRGALEAKGRTIAVLGNGLNYIYPPENEYLSKEIAESGALISEFPLSKSPARENFPRRNRIISGISLGTVVVEAGERSGSLITANLALNEGREVFAVPYHPGSSNSQGTNRLIQNGAKLIESVDDIIDELTPQLKKYIELNKRKKAQIASENEINSLYIEELEKHIFGILSEKPLNLEEIALQSKVDRKKIVSSLLSLEVKGLVKKISDDIYIKTDAGDVIE